MIFDTFMISGELDMLECRMMELETVPSLVHVAVEADVDHQDHPKPFHLTENLERFAQWGDRLRVVRATGLPSVADYPDPWAREHAQREWVPMGLTDADAGDVLLHGDIDEIPTAVVTRNLKPSGYLALGQRGHFWSCRWLYPEVWCGTVAARVGDVKSFGAFRDVRNIAKRIPNAGWHLSWLGGPEAALAKVEAFCHPEVRDRIVNGLDTDLFLSAGVHVDGLKMTRCEIDASFPRYVREGLCPASWVL